MSGQDQNLELLEMLLSSIKLRGYKKTLSILQVGDSTNVSVTDPYELFVIQSVVDEFEITLEDILYNKFIRGINKYAVGFCVYYLYDNRTMGDLRRRIFRGRSTTLLSKYRQMILQLDEDIFENKKYLKNKKKQQSRVIPDLDLTNAPKVTVQLPMFNEMYVAERIIETVAQMDYPREKFQIQVLDDSTDETKDIIANKCAEVAARGINIQHVHRVDRTGYKAGALDAAMDKVEGEFIAIFDADFVPSQDFLLRTIP